MKQLIVRKENKEKGETNLLDRFNNHLWLMILVLTEGNLNLDHLSR